MMTNERYENNKSIRLDENHQYWLDEIPIDGLTSTLQEAGLIRDSGSFYKERGTAVHLATEYYDKGTLDEESVTDDIKGYLESWKRFRETYTPVEIEYITYHPILLVGTTIDRLPLLDIKTGGEEKWHILQIALQYDALCCHGMRDFVEKPMVVYLDANGGNPVVKVYSKLKINEAFKVYCSMLHFIRWRRER